MCTVTYIPKPDGFLLTSSRDEKINRTTLPPRSYTHNHQELIYPKDTKGLGSWIAISHKKRIACLLNGAFENHAKKETYTKSRGLILTESFNYLMIDDFINDIDLLQTEPFTLLLLDYHTEIICFKELVWDGTKKHINSINPNQPKIWSSATLYDLETRKNRSQWFANWLIQLNNLNNIEPLDFHLRKHSSNDAQNILMKRENDLQTVSISKIEMNSQQTEFNYIDLLNNTKNNLIISSWLNRLFHDCNVWQR